MTLKGDAKFKKKLTCDLKNDMRNLVNFSASSGKSENLHFKVVLKFQLKSTEEWSLMTLKKHANFEEKLTFCLKNDMRNLVNFNTSTGKSENLHFDGLRLWKVGNVWAKKIQRSCIMKNDLWFQKWHKSFGEFHTSSWK